MKTNLFRLTAIGLAAFLVGCATPTSDNGGNVIVTGPTGPSTLFKDAGLTFTVDPAGGTGTTEKAQINGWSGGTDTVANTTNTGPAKITFGGHGGGWAGGVGLVQKPSNYTGNYDFSGVTSITFKIKSATITPNHLAIAAQSTSNGDQIALLSSLVSDITAWTPVTINVSTLFGANNKTDVKTALAIYWGSSAADTASNSVGDFYEIGDIQFVDGSGANVGFYSGVSLPPPVTSPTVAAAAPTLAAADVVNLYTSSSTYTNPAAVWTMAPGWYAPTGVNVTDDTTSVPGVTLKKFVFVTTNFTGTELGAPATITGKKTLHVSYFTNDGTAMAIKVDLAGSGAGVTVVKNSLTQGAWHDLEFDFSAFTPTTMNQFLFDGSAGGSTGTFWVDNIYFH